MDRGSGEIRGIEDWEEMYRKNGVSKTTYENLVPFNEGEEVEIKGCKFRVKYVHPWPKNTMLLQGIAK